MPSGKKARQLRHEEAAARRTPPPVRSKGVGGIRTRQASPRALAIAGVVVAAVIVAIVLGVTLSGGGKSTATSNFPKVGSATSPIALPGSTDVRALYKGIPQSGVVLGSPKAPATLTEFIDLQCPDCKMFELEQMPTIVQKYVRSGKLDIRMEPWSILSAPDSPRGQAATLAASLQNKGFQFAQMLYLNQGVENTGWLTEDMVGTAASSVDGLDPRRVLDDQTSSRVKAGVSDVDTAASAQNFTGTPTILLNHKGQKAHVVSLGVPDAATLQSQIESAIQG
ncbi:MAG TPA: thioredoxin domain-containing protein [Gaiellaceae bacterium]|nr:thioredoxin domain-containing protein [Gaiellaceae bacterium]